jgi:hypothetical protein
MPSLPSWVAIARLRTEKGRGKHAGLKERRQLGGLHLFLNGAGAQRAHRLCLCLRSRAQQPTIMEHITEGLDVGRVTQLGPDSRHAAVVVAWRRYGAWFAPARRPQRTQRGADEACQGGRTTQHGRGRIG